MVIGKVNRTAVPIKDLLFSPRDEDMRMRTMSIFVGKQGGGKSISLVSMALAYLDAGRMKVVDVFGGKRKEYLYYPLPSSQTKYWETVQKKLNVDKPIPKAYKTHYLIPCWKGGESDYNRIHKRLPHNENCRCTFFTLDVNKILPNYLSAGYRKIDPTNSSLWQNAVEKMKPNYSSHMMQYFMGAKGEKAPFVQYIKKMTDNLLLQGSGCPSNLDIESEIDAKDEITVIVTDFLPSDEYKFFVIITIMRMIEKYVTASNGKDTMILAREVSTFFTEQSGDTPAYINCFKNEWKEIGKQSRSGIHITMDTQQISDLKGLFAGSYTYSCFMKTTRKELETGLGDQSTQVSNIQKQMVDKLKVGQFLFVPSEGQATIRYNFLPRCEFWAEGSGDCWARGGLWEKRVNKWVATAPQMAGILDFSSKDEAMAKRLTRKRREKRKEVDEDEGLEDEIILDDEEIESEDDDEIEGEKELKEDLEEVKKKEELEKTPDYDI